MDFDLEIIDEEGDDCHDPLFNSIMNAMNSMKEATADKIYQKIQKEGQMNYSKPQVDRALANALKYGIFEVRNNRYKVRDDILDDEDTVYWKLHKDKEQTPFRAQDDINDRQSGPKLDPEKDNQRFRRLIKKKSQECPNCGKAKKPVLRVSKLKAGKKTEQGQKNKKYLKKDGKNEASLKRKFEIKRKRKRKSDLKGQERCSKRKKTSETSYDELQELNDKEFHPEENLPADKKNKRRLGSNTKPSDGNISPTSDYNFESKYTIDDHVKSFKQSKNFQSQHELECRDGDIDIVKVKQSSVSIKTSESEKTDLTSDSEDQCQDKNTNPFFDNLPCTSKNSNKTKNQCLSSTEAYSGQYETYQTDHQQEKSDWLACSDEPQGAIIQTNNVLTIEPMDSLSFKSPEQASYIS